MEKSSIAPLVARIPNLIPPPSKAGPAEQAAQAGRLDVAGALDKPPFVTPGTDRRCGFLD